MEEGLCPRADNACPMCEAGLWRSGLPTRSGAGSPDIRVALPFPSLLPQPVPRFFSAGAVAESEGTEQHELNNDFVAAV